MKKTAEIKPYKKGFHPLYLWGVSYVLFTYLYPVLLSYSALFLCIPLLLLAANIGIAAGAGKRFDGGYFLNTALIIKYALIPFYLLGGLAILLFAFLTITPVVIMLFVGPMAVIMLLALGWISMAGSAPITIAYLCHSVKAGKNSLLFAVLIGITQFFFGLDVLGIVISAFREKRFIKLTIVVFSGTFLLVLGSILWLAAQWKGSLS